MADVTMDQIKELRKRTGVGISSVKEALENSGGDMEKAVAYLREKVLQKLQNELEAQQIMAILQAIFTEKGRLG